MYIASDSQRIGDKSKIRNKDIKGKVAILTEEVGFFTSTSASLNNRSVFPAGTEVIAQYQMTVTDLTVFKFPNGHNFQLRPNRFTWK